MANTVTYQKGGYSVSTTCTYDWQIKSFPSDKSYVESPIFESTVVGGKFDQSQSGDDSSSATSQQLQNRFGDPITWQISLDKLSKSGLWVDGEDFVNLGFYLSLDKVPWTDSSSLGSIRKSGKVAFSLLVDGERRHRTEATEFKTA